MEERSETSVWHVATVATVVFVGIIILAGAFGGGETAVTIATR